MMNLNELRGKAYKIACEQRFHDEKHGDTYYLMLVIGDLAEAAKAYREEYHTPEHVVELLKPLQSVEYYLPIFDHYTEGTVEMKLADALIGLFDFAGLRGIHLDSGDIFISDLGPDFISSIYNICRELTYSKLTLKGRIGYTIQNILFLCKEMNIDIEWLVTEKMKYNSVKGYKCNKTY